MSTSLLWTSWDWRIMYATRRRIDNIALNYLDRLLEYRAELRQLGELVLGLSMDVWDVFELEADRPIFSSSAGHDVHETDSEVIPPHAFTRRFWAKSLLCMLSGNHAVLTWRRFCIPDAPNSTFEETINTLSCFFGYSSQRIARHLDQLSIRCRGFLVARGIILDPASYGYSTLVLCREICTFMQNEGFTKPCETEYDNIMNRFPHAYLTSYRKAIPISLVHVFAGIGRRLGIEISPLNVLGVVLAHVVPKESGMETIIVNPSARAETEFVEEISRSQARLQTLYPAIAVQEHFIPRATRVMLGRASRNIVASFGNHTGFINSGRSIIYPSLLLSLCAQLLVDRHNDGLESLADTLKPMASPLDCIFLLRSLSPMLWTTGQESVKRYCDGVWDDEVERAVKVHRRSPVNAKYFIGMPCLDSSGELCFIFSWDIIHTTPPLVSDQPERDSYHLLRLDGTMRLIFPQGNVVPTTFTEADVRLLLTGTPEAGRYFSGVQLPKDPTKGVEHRDGRGRLLLSPHAIREYPEDNEVGASWVDHGFGNDRSFDELIGGILH